MTDEIKILIQPTPNPAARKFVCNRDVKSEGKVSFSEMDQLEHIKLAREIFMLTNVTQVHFFENVITVTQNGLSEWEGLAGRVMATIRQYLPDHDPSFMTAEEKRRESLPPELQEIDAILERTIRPGLQGDGGDVQVMELEGNSLAIHYEGACGSCPSSAMGTLDAIRHILREEYHPELEVYIV